jgi:hypothetical protein
MYVFRARSRKSPPLLSVLTETLEEQTASRKYLNGREARTLTWSLFKARGCAIQSNDSPASSLQHLVVMPFSYGIRRVVLLGGVGERPVASVYLLNDSMSRTLGERLDDDGMAMLAIKL